jgi:TRAP-type C4-dicarboxylate transport system permease small subunit
MILIAIDVALRKILNQPINGGYEIASLFMAMLVFFALAYTQQQKSAIHVTLFVTRFKGRTRYVIWTLGLLLATGMAGYFAYGSFVHGGLVRLVGTESGTLRIPYWPFYYVGAFSFGLYAIVMAIDAVKSFAAVFSEKYAVEVASHWND